MNVLICNAGVMAIPAPGTMTVDEFETQFATNHLAHFLLFNLLKPSLLVSSTPELNSRVVLVSSSAHKDPGGTRLDDYSLKKGDYTPLAAYARSKTANIYMANYIDRHFGPHGIHATSLHPDVIWTQLQRYVSEELKERWKSILELVNGFKSTTQGVAMTVWAAIGKEWEGKGGKYLDNLQVALPTEEGEWGGYVEWTYDKEKEDRLWADSLKMVGLV